MLLRWPGGKKKAAKLMLSYAPDGFKEFRDPFVGGNGLLHEVPEGVKIWINDIYPWLIWFWQFIRDDPDCVERIMERKAICLALHDYPDAARQYFYDCRWRIRQRYCPVDFLNLNVWAVGAMVSPFRRDIASFSSLWQRDGWNHVHAKNVQMYKDRLQGAKITLGDYSVLLDAPGKDVWLAVDPPYLVVDHNSPIYAYPFKEHDHRLLAERLKRCPHDWLLTVGNSRLMEELYRGCRTRTRAYTGLMTHRSADRKEDKDKTELFVLSERKAPSNVA